MLLLVHGEVTDSEVDMFDREAVFITQKLVGEEEGGKGGRRRAGWRGGGLGRSWGGGAGRRSWGGERVAVHPDVRG